MKRLDFFTILWLALPVLVTSGLLLALQQDDALKNLTQHQLETVALLSAQIAADVDTENLPSVQQTLHEATPKAELAYLLIYRKNYQILMQENYLATSTLPTLASTDSSYPPPKHRLFTDPKTQASYLTVSAPIYKPTAQGDKPNLVGYIQTGVSLRGLNHKANQLVLKTFSVALLMTILSYLLITRQTRRTSLLTTKTLEQNHPAIAVLDPLLNQLHSLTAHSSRCLRLIKRFLATAQHRITVENNTLGKLEKRAARFKAACVRLGHQALVDDAAELSNNRLQLTAFAALAAAQRIARLGYWSWFPKSGEFHLSDYLVGLCGIDINTFDGTLNSYLQLIHPEDRAGLNQFMLTAAHSNLIKSIDYRLQTNSADYINVHQEIEIIIDNDEVLITGTVQDISHRKAAEKQLTHLAYFDSLTGLASRSYYHERIDGLIRAANRYKEQFAFLFLNLDGFKDITDHHGHHAGDEFLKTIALRLKSVVRDIDFIARLGGDEFCIILANITDDEAVVEMTTRCLHYLSQPLLLGTHEVIPSVSIGIAMFPRDGSHESELIKAADTALSAAKKLGKQQAVFHSPNLSQQVTQRQKKERQLRKAFKEKQFVLHYQPQISLITGHIVGVEALVRWHHPEQGIIFPDEFIGLVEQFGLIVALGNWALETACEQLAHWHQLGLNNIQMAVNLSSIHFQEAHLVETVRCLLEKTGIPAHSLELEVTESSMQTTGHIDAFNQLRALGVKIAIDDFGTGFSCLASLQQLPLDCLKIDKVFINDMLDNPHTALLLGTIIGLANALGYTMVAEGVETKEQATTLKEMGCSIMQGFLYSPALAGDDIPNWIKSHSHRLQNEADT